MRCSITIAAILVAIPLAVATAGLPTVRLSVPPPNWYGIEDLWRATVVSDTEGDAWFEGFVYEENQGQVFWAKTKPFQLARGTKVYGYRSTTVDQTKTAPGYRALATRTGQLPEGRYRFKLVLKRAGGGYPDSVRFEVKPVVPPRPIKPRDGEVVEVPDPMFIWSPASGAPIGATHDLEVYEVLPEQTPTEAATTNSPLFVVRGIMTISLRWPSWAPRLDSEAQYAWRSIIRYGGGEAVGPISSFSYSPGQMQAEEEECGERDPNTHGLNCPTCKAIGKEAMDRCDTCVEKKGHGWAHCCTCGHAWPK